MLFLFLYLTHTHTHTHTNTHINTHKHTYGHEHVKTQYTQKRVVEVIQENTIYREIEDMKSIENILLD